jgi:hypothetical protein
MGVAIQQLHSLALILPCGSGIHIQKVLSLLMYSTGIITHVMCMMVFWCIAYTYMQGSTWDDVLPTYGTLGAAV